MLIKILFSFLITSLVGVLIGLIFVSKFWYVFSLAVILQVLFFYFLNTVYENRLIEKAQRLKLEEFKEASKQVALVECPCQEKSKQEVEMRFDQDIIYQCNKCGKSCKAAVDVKTLLVTEPIYFNDRT